MKPYFVAANWKMNGSKKLVLDLIEALQVVESDLLDIGLFLPSPYMAEATAMVGQTMIVGAQHISQHESGAFTGEVSCAMLQDLGVSAALIGHSERRQLFGETDDLCGQRLKRALKSGIAPVLCVGETLEEREQGIVESVSAAQLASIDMGSEYANPAIAFTIAYEPVWAIGTGKQASPEEADEDVLVADTQQAVCSERRWQPLAGWAYGGNKPVETGSTSCIRIARHAVGVRDGSRARAGTVRLLYTTQPVKQAADLSPIIIRRRGKPPDVKYRGG